MVRLVATNLLTEHTPCFCTWQWTYMTSTYGKHGKCAYLQAEKHPIFVLEDKHTVHYPTINAIQQVAVA